MTPDPVFGLWVMSADGKVCHMHLAAGPSVCGSQRWPEHLITAREEANRRRDAEPAKPSNNKPPDPNYVAYCPDCVSLETSRWVGMYRCGKPKREVSA